VAKIIGTGREVMGRRKNADLSDGASVGQSPQGATTPSSVSCAT
jgi:hypothetical protein